MGADADVLRAMIGLVAERPRGLEVGAHTGAAWARRARIGWLLVAPAGVPGYAIISTTFLGELSLAACAAFGEAEAAFFLNFTVMPHPFCNLFHI